MSTPHDPANWTEGDDTDLDHCTSHSQTSDRHDACSTDLARTLEAPDGRKHAACKKAAHDALRHHAKRL
ncbi:hypothetical protein ACFYTC_29985 [Actinomadura nitritigenes]|uniref:hypothetical protein n=1 Tax=Actinomadura nitritigenes TaxID=134602 RepID=UPI0036B46F08